MRHEGLFNRWHNYGKIPEQLAVWANIYSVEEGAAESTARVVKRHAPIRTVDRWDLVKIVFLHS